MFAEPELEHYMGMAWDIKGTAVLVLYTMVWHMAEWKGEGVHWCNVVQQTV